MFVELLLYSVIKNGMLFSGWIFWPILQFEPSSTPVKGSRIFRTSRQGTNRGSVPINHCALILKENFCCRALILAELKELASVAYEVADSRVRQLTANQLRKFASPAPTLSG